MEQPSRTPDRYLIVGGEAQTPRADAAVGLRRLYASATRLADAPSYRRTGVGEALDEVAQGVLERDDSERFDTLQTKLEAQLDGTTWNDDLRGLALELNAADRELRPDDPEPSMQEATGLWKTIADQTLLHPSDEIFTEGDAIFSELAGLSDPVKREASLRALLDRTEDLLATAATRDYHERDEVQIPRYRDVRDALVLELRKPKAAAPTPLPQQPVWGPPRQTAGV